MRRISGSRWKPATFALAIDAYAVACALVFVSRNGFPSWFWLPHSAVVLVALILIGYTLHDVTRQAAIDDQARITWVIAVLLAGGARASCVLPAGHRIQVHP